MVVINKGADTQIVVTVTEKKELPAPFFLFVFEHVTTKEVVKLVINGIDDLSGYPARYNDFLIPASTFATATQGQWNYFIYEQDNGSNLDADGLSEVEVGKMILKETTFSYNGYDKKTTYSGYGG